MGPESRVKNNTSPAYARADSCLASRGSVNKKRRKVTYICRSHKKKAVTYFLLIFFIAFFFLGSTQKNPPPPPPSFGCFVLSCLSRFWAFRNKEEFKNSICCFYRAAGRFSAIGAARNRHQKEIKN
jgi:hypothetical protein